MSTTTVESPAARLATIRKTITDAKRAEKAAISDLPSSEWHREYERRKARTLCTTKVVDVDVDVEIDKEDLADLGYHHEDDCPASSVDVAAARQPLADWHDRTHGLTLWSACSSEPCNALPLEFRSL